MSTAETGYRARANVPVMIERARTQVSAIVLYTPSGVAAPASAGTYTLLKPGGTAVISAAAITTNATGAEYEIDASDIPANNTTAPLGQGWQERWALTMPDGTQRTFRRSASMALFELHPCVVDVDLTDLYPDLLDSLGNYRTNLQTWIDNAWSTVMRALHRNGDWPFIIVEPSDIYEWVREQAFVNVFRALHKMSAGTGSNEDWKALWDSHEMGLRAAREGARITVDRDQDGIADHDGKDSAGANKPVQWNYPHSSNPRHVRRKFR